MKNLIFYIVIINTLAFFIVGLDKRKAKRQQWRIPEATLIGIAFLGGSIGTFLGMHVFHHKTKKPKFYIGIPLILILQVIGMGVISC